MINNNAFMYQNAEKMSVSLLEIISFTILYIAVGCWRDEQTKAERTLSRYREARVRSTGLNEK